MLDDDEIVVEIRVPPVPKDARQTFIKFAQRPTIDFAVVNAAVPVENGPTGRCRKQESYWVPSHRCRTGLPKPKRLLKGKAVTEALAERAAATLEGKAVVLSSNSYKLQIAKTLLKRVILAES